jgi:DNA segregation ATPase FtsK/SpoIIIE-like protein
MMREASVKRKTDSTESGNLPFEGRRVSSKPPTDYQLPSLDFLNEAQMRSEQADDELLGMATKLAEKCREFNVTGQIKFICPWPSR